MAAVETLFGVIIPTFIERLKQIILAPAEYPGMVWILLPMVITLLLMTLYFGRYRREELGWNTAVGNALVLLFVGLDLLQQVYPEQNPLRALLVFARETFTQGFTASLTLPGIVAGAILLYALFLLTADFHHWLPKKLAFFISSGLPINVLAYFGIIFVYGATAGVPMVLDWYTLAAFFTLFWALYFVLSVLQLVEKDEDKIVDAPRPEISADESDGTLLIDPDDPAIRK